MNILYFSVSSVVKYSLLLLRPSVQKIKKCYTLLIATRLPQIDRRTPLDTNAFSCHGIMFEILGYLKSEKSIKPDEDMGGCFVSEDQVAGHLCTFRYSI